MDAKQDGVFQQSVQQTIFDEYTGKGKAFFFLLAKNKNREPAYKKIAVVIDDDGNFEEYFDAPDDSMTYQQFVRAVRQTMIGFNLDAHESKLLRTTTLMIAIR